NKSLQHSAPHRVLAASCGFDFWILVSLLREDTSRQVAGRARADAFARARAGPHPGGKSSRQRAEDREGGRVDRLGIELAPAGRGPSLRQPWRAQTGEGSRALADRSARQ